MAATLDQLLGPIFRPTGLTGGGSTNLDGIATVGLNGLRALVVTGGNVTFYELQTGTGNTPPATVRPVDYNASTNIKNWVKQTFA